MVEDHQKDKQGAKKQLPETAVGPLIPA